MARIAGVDLPNDKRVEIALTYIYGIGKTSSDRILKDTQINPDTRVKDLSEDDIAKIRDQIENNRPSSQNGSSCSWSAHKDECSYS